MGSGIAQYSWESVLVYLVCLRGQWYVHMLSWIRHWYMWPRPSTDDHSSYDRSLIIVNSSWNWGETPCGEILAWCINWKELVYATSKYTLRTTIEILFTNATEGVRGPGSHTVHLTWQFACHLFFISRFLPTTSWDPKLSPTCAHILPSELPRITRT